MTHNKLLNFKNNQALLGASLMIAAGLMFAIINTLVQAVTMRMGVASTSVAFWQYFIALLFSVPWVISHLKSAFGTKQIHWHIVRVAFAVVGVQLWIMGLAHVPIWQAIALIMTSPFFVTIGAALLLGERVSYQRWLAVLVGFIGGMIILSPWSDAFSMAALYPVGAALFWALSSIVTKYLTETEKAETLTLYLLLMLTPINAALAFGGGFAIRSSNALWLIIGAGVLTAAAQYALAKAYSVADAAYLQPFDHLKLPLNVILGFVVFGFAPEGEMWIGTALIIIASFYLLNAEMKAEKQVPQAA